MYQVVNGRPSSGAAHDLHIKVPNSFAWSTHMKSSNRLICNILVKFENTAANIAALQRGRVVSLGNNGAAPVGPVHYNILYTLSGHHNPGTYAYAETYRQTYLTPLIRYQLSMEYQYISDTDITAVNSLFSNYVWCHNFANQ